MKRILNDVCLVTYCCFFFICSIQSTHPIQSQAPGHFSRARRGRRGGNNGGYSRLREFSARQINSVQEINSAQTSSHAIDSPAMMQQTSNFGPFYMNPYLGPIYPNQFAIGHHSTTAAQHATGTPLYSYGYPYHSVIYPTMMPVDFVLDEKSDDGMPVRFCDYLILRFVPLLHA